MKPRSDAWTAAPARPLARAYRSEELHVVEGLGQRFDAVPSGPWSDPPDTAVVLSILVLWIMYAQDYPALAYGEVVLILETLMHLVLAVWSALKAILLGIVVFGLLFAFLLPVLIVLRDLWKKRNQPSGASGSR